MAAGGIPLPEWSGSGATADLHETIKKSNAIIEKQTKVLIRLTYLLVALTVVLVILTVVLVKKA